MNKFLRMIVRAFGQEHREQSASGRLEHVSSLGKSEGASNRDLTRDDSETSSDSSESVEADLEKSRVSLVGGESLPNNPQIDTRRNWDNVIQDKHTGDDSETSSDSSESVEADLFSPLFLPEEHQPEEMMDALMPGGELHPSINDNVKPMEPEPIQSVQSWGELPPHINDNMGRYAKPVEPEPIQSVQSRGKLPPIIDNIGRHAKPFEPEHIESIQSMDELPTNVNDNIGKHAKSVEPEPIESVQSRGKLPPNINDNMGRHAKPVEAEPIESVQSRGELPSIINENIGRHAKPFEPEPIESIQSTGELPTNVNDNIVSHAKPVEPELIESVQSRGKLHPNINDNIGSHVKPVEPEPIEAVQSRGELPPIVNGNIGRHAKPLEPEPIESVQSRGELPTNVNDSMVSYAKPVVPEPIESVQSRGELPPNINDNIVSHAKLVEPEPIESVQSMGKLHPNIDDNIGSHVKPVEPEPTESNQSTLGQANLFEEIKIEAPEKLHDPESGSKGDEMLDEHHGSVSTAIEVQTPANPHEIIEEKLKAAEVKSLYDKDNSQVSPEEESLLNVEPQTDTRGKLANVTANESADNDSCEDNETVEVDLSSSPLLSEEHQSEEIPDASKLGSELPTNINDTIGRNVEPAELESVTSVQSTPNQANLLDEINIEIAENSDASGSGSKVSLDQTIPAPEEVITTEQIYTERSPESDSNILTTVATGATQDDETAVYIGVQTDPPTDSGERYQWEWDILKAIVYGGLLESIASLGVVSSAASSNVATVNIVALGLANLVGGLLVFIHHLMELKNKQQESLDGKEQVDLYVELLGRRDHFYRHATIALLSYILFGVLPPVVYGFSFWQSDDKLLKLIVVAAASLLCVTLLALGKAHVQEQKAYGKTLLYYLGIGVGVSGVSFAFGLLVKQLLESLGLFNDSVDVSAYPVSSVLEVMSENLSWTSS